MTKYRTPTKMISARIMETNLKKLESMSISLGMPKNELLNQAVEE